LAPFITTKMCISDLSDDVVYMIQSRCASLGVPRSILRSVSTSFRRAALSNQATFQVSVPELALFSRRTYHISKVEDNSNSDDSHNDVGIDQDASIVDNSHNYNHNYNDNYNHDIVAGGEHASAEESALATTTTTTMKTLDVGELAFGLNRFAPSYERIKNALRDDMHSGGMLRRAVAEQTRILRTIVRASERSKPSTLIIAPPDQICLNHTNDDPLLREYAARPSKVALRAIADGEVGEGLRGAVQHLQCGPFVTKGLFRRLPMLRTIKLTLYCVGRRDVHWAHRGALAMLVHLEELEVRLYFGGRSSSTDHLLTETVFDILFDTPEGKTVPNLKFRRLALLLQPNLKHIIDAVKRCPQLRRVDVDLIASDAFHNSSFQPRSALLPSSLTSSSSSSSSTSSLQSSSMLQELHIGSSICVSELNSITWHMARLVVPGLCVKTTCIPSVGWDMDCMSLPIAAHLTCISMWYYQINYYVRPVDLPQPEMQKHAAFTGTVVLYDCGAADAPYATTDGDDVPSAVEKVTQALPNTSVIIISSATVCSWACPTYGRLLDRIAAEVTRRSLDVMITSCDVRFLASNGSETSNDGSETSKGTNAYCWWLSRREHGDAKKELTCTFQMPIAQALPGLGQLCTGFTAGGTNQWAKVRHELLESIARVGLGLS
jgi:hypothetical protein